MRAVCPPFARSTTAVRLLEGWLLHIDAKEMALTQPEQLASILLAYVTEENARNGH